MKRSFWNLVFVTVLATGFALAHAPYGQDQTQRQPPMTPDQTSPQTQPGQYPQQYPPSSTQPSQDSTSSSTAAGSSDVETRIQQAIQQDPTLANSSVSANVSDNQINLTGTAATKAERDRAVEIAKANAEGRKVVDHIKVSKSGSSTSPSNVPPYE